MKSSVNIIRDAPNNRPEPRITPAMFTGLLNYWQTVNAGLLVVIIHKKHSTIYSTRL